ncbi:PLP-dependent transferase [Stereum hirsutum FP-91666 SS1]|uniref:PLP-dependent transferase n=1 Tax=Stereum hirsutum (strain FP-91666) TaxID=721885 RepID=UPI00044499E8|nr:PLP-dependent transferase [Stereum hirsutum FP-91666 SS1]EIM84645.1 PLP-dependent transferase [Stereum hirsutum FP-91666 SS1]
MAVELPETAPILATPPATSASSTKPTSSCPTAEPKDDFSHLAHHLNTLSRSRGKSPLKDILQYMTLDGMISLAGGLPHPDFFPFNSVEVQAYKSNTRVDPDAPPPEYISLTVSDSAGAKELTDNLQYGQVSGNPALVSLLHKLALEIFKPLHPSHYEILLNSGNTDAWNKIVSLLLEPGDSVLVEEHTYPSAQAVWIPMGIKGVPIDMDGEGMKPEVLEKVINSWDEGMRGKRPRVLYTVPVGQNPTGATMPAARKKVIYDICKRHDIIIVEDDPYYFLQLPAYKLPSENSRADNSSLEKLDIASLEPSFLRYDEDGRVIRLESFSKTIAPGSRLGYFVCNPLFAERLLRGSEVMSQAPSGWSQAIVLKLLQSWGIDGYLEWLQNLRHSYAVRRDWMCDALNEYFDLNTPSGSIETYAYLKSVSSTTTTERKPIFSFTPPAAGMFIYLKFHLSHLASFQSILASQPPPPSAEDEWVAQTWKKLADAKVLLTPGTYYTPFQGEPSSTNLMTPREKGVAFFRLAFSFVDRDEMVEGIKRMAKVLEDL